MKKHSFLYYQKKDTLNKYEWESDTNNNFKRTSMGIVMKRRDNAPMLNMFMVI